MTYKEKVLISQEELNWYNNLLQLNLEDNTTQNAHDIERLSAKTNDYIGIRTIEFENGNYVTIDLASGTSNYYDNIVLWNKDGYELMVNDCNYKISDFSLDYDNDIYDIEIEVF